MANKVQILFEAVGADKLAQAFGQVQSGAEKAGASAEKAGQGAAKAGQSAGDAAKHVDVLGLSLNKMSGLAGQAGVDLSVFQRAAQGAHESMSMLAGGFSAGTVAAGTFVTGIAAMTGVLVAASQHLVSSYNEIKTFSAISGMAAGDADDLADAMQAVGVSSQQLSMALFKLEDDAAGGGEALLKLGISMDDLKSKSSGDLFVSVIDKIQALGSQSEKTQALVEIFGARLGRAFADLVREGGMSIDQLKAKVADLSPWTKEMETNARNLAVAQTFLSNAIGGVVDMLGNAFAPILTTAINAMTDWVVSIRKSVENSGQLGNVINMLVDVFKALWEALSPLMPLLKDIGLLAVDVGLALMAAFQGVMIGVVALTGAIAALWAAIQKGAEGDFSGALTALQTGLAATEVAVGKQIARFNEQVLANQKLSESLHGVSTSWEDLGSYTHGAGEEAGKAAPKIRDVGDAAKKAADEAKKAAEVISAWEKSVGRVGLTAALIYDDVERLRSAMEFDDLQASIQGVEAFHASLTKLQGSIDALHMNEAEKELAGFRAELDKIPGLGDAAKAALLNAAEGIIAVRDAAKEGVKELQDAAKYMTSLGTAAETAKAPLENLGQYVGDLEPRAASAGEAMAILTDRVERLIPPNTIESITQYGDALRELDHTAADGAVTFDLLNDRVSESGEASLKAEQRWQKFGTGLKGMFDSVGDTFGKITTGLIQGTLDIDDAFKNLGQSLLINFANTVFDAILDEAEGFVHDFIDTIVSGISSFDWGGFFKTVMGFLGGGGGGGGGFSGGGDWWDDIGFDMYAHGGLVRRTGPAVLHAGETVVPAGYGSGWQSSGFMPSGGGGGGGGYGGTVPVRVENVDAFGQQFGYWAGKTISVAPYALQAAGWLTGSAGLSGAGQGLGIMGALKTGYNMFTNAPNIPGGFGPSSWFGSGPAFDPTSMTNMYAPGSVGPFNTGFGSATNMISIGSGLGSLLSMIGGLTGVEGLGHAGMAISGASLVASLVNSLAPTLIPAIGSAISGVFSAGLGATVSSIGSSIAGAAGSVAAGGFAGIGASIGSFAAGMGPAAIAFGPAILASILVPMFQKNEEKNYAANRQGMAFTTDLFKGLSSVTMADLTSNESLRSDLGKLAGNLFGTGYANLGRMPEQIAQDKAAHIQALTEAGADMSLPDTQASIAMYDRQLEVLSKLAEQFQELGIQAEFSSDAIANFGDYAGQMGFNFLEALSNLMTQVTTSATTAGQEVAASNREVASTTSAVVRNQADLIIKYGGTVEALRQISTQLELGVDIPDLAKLTVEQLEYLGTATGAQIEDMITGWKTAITDAIVTNPIKLLPLLDMTKLKQFDETVEETAARVGQALTILGGMMQSLELEALSLTDPLGAATLGFQQTIDAVNSADWDDMAENMRNADPTDWAEAAVTAHDLLIARYEAEIALIQQIVAAVDQLGQTAVALTEMGPFLHAVGVNIGPAVEAFTGMGSRPPAGPGGFAIGTGGDEGGFATGGEPGLMASPGGDLVNALPTAEAALTHFGHSVQAFANLAQLAGQSADPALIQSSIETWTNLMGQIPNTFQQIMAIEDPSQRMSALTTFMQEVGTAAQAAAAGLAALVDHINQLVAGVAQAAGALTSHADIFAKVGVNLKGAAEDMARFSMEIPTMAGKLTALSSAADLGIAAMQTGGAPDPQVFVNATVAAVQAAMALTDPGQRVEALSGIMDTISKVLSALPPEMRDAVIKEFGPGFKFIGDSIISAGKEQAAAAIAAGNQLTAIIGPSGALNPQNFILMMVGGINSSLDAIIGGVGPAFDVIVNALTGAGKDIAGAITTAGIALSNALGTFSTAADQLKSALETLDDDIGKAVQAGVSQALTDHGLQTGSGVAGVASTGLYVLHEGERVLNRGENVDYQTGRQGAGVTVTLSFGDIHLARGGRQEAEEFIATVEASIKHGRLRNAVQRAAVGQA